MNAENFLPRLIEPELRDALADSPVVLIHGPRQCGKTTLARRVGESLGYTYLNLDDPTQRAAAEADPVGFVQDLPERAIIDEVQHAPALFAAIKTVVDRDRRPGRFLLTGSANVLLLPKLADSLAGRMEIIRLFPLAQVEIERRQAGFLDALFGAGFASRQSARLGPELAARIVAGGYPAALTRTSTQRRTRWYRNYLEAMVQRDVRDLARIAALDALPRLLEVAAGQTARLVNVSELASPFQLSRPTIRDYITLLERVFLLDDLPAWHSNRLSRLVKTAKLHIGDTGLAAALLGLDADSLYRDRPLYGQMVESFVFQELRRQAGAHSAEIRFHHFRDKDGYEVDLVLERSGRRVAGIEIKAAASVAGSDFRGLRKLAAATGERFAAGVVLYDGETGIRFDERLFAIPIRTLWESGS
jgi:predicted AAA+ superfamily ATPase